MDPKAKERYQAHFRANIRLVIQLLIIWFLVSYGAALVVNQLNGVNFIGFPLGYYMGAQGSLIVFVALIFVYAFRMAKIDKDHGVEE